MTFTVRVYDESDASFVVIDVPDLAVAIREAERLCRLFAGNDWGGWDVVPADDETTDKPLATGRINDQSPEKT
jgi:hypothetical protein